MSQYDDWSDLDAAFELSPTVVEEKWRLLYEHIVARMRAEADGMPMTVVQQMLLERIAANYIYMKRKESLGQFPSDAAQKQAVTYWLSMTENFNKMLLKKGPEHMRTQIYKEVTEKVLNVFSKITDPTLRDVLQGMLIKELDS